MVQASQRNRAEKHWPVARRLGGVVVVTLPTMWGSESWGWCWPLGHPLTSDSGFTCSLSLSLLPLSFFPLSSTPPLSSTSPLQGLWWLPSPDPTAGRPCPPRAPAACAGSLSCQSSVPEHPCSPSRPQGQASGLPHLGLVSHRPKG